MKIYKADGDTQVVTMKDINDLNPDNNLDPTDDLWIKASDCRNLLKEIVPYLELHCDSKKLEMLCDKIHNICDRIHPQFVKKDSCL